MQDNARHWRQDITCLKDINRNLNKNNCNREASRSRFKYNYVNCSI